MLLVCVEVVDAADAAVAVPNLTTDVGTIEGRGCKTVDVVDDRGFGFVF